jgi:dihydropteroate synthase-like protein
MTEQADHIHFVTGRLAEHALSQTLRQLAPQAGFSYSLQVLPITVAALMSPGWIQRHIRPPAEASRVLVPGYCGGDLDPLANALGIPVERGPRDLRQLPEFFGQREAVARDWGQYSIEIIAEINHARRWERAELLDEARKLADDGADLIDVGCEPGEPWLEVGECVQALRDQGHRVSIDSFHPAEIERATRAGAELVLSVNATNRHAAADWGCEVVVIPDHLTLLDSLDETIALLDRAGVPLRVDPVLEPIGFGFATSLWRYMDVRRRYPERAMLMGIGNLTEMTDADSAAINVLLLGICQELGIRSVLTTQVINWARSSVRECDIARRLVYHAVRNRVPPKHVTSDLVLLRDRKLVPFGEEQLQVMASQIQDHNVRILVEQGCLHLMRSGGRWSGTDPFALFEQMVEETAERVDPPHAFYLGFELCKAATALLLSKEYRQDEALDWGYLTVEEHFHRLARRRNDW